MTEKFDNKAVYLDTAPLIYYLEETSPYFSFLQTIFKKNESGDFTFFTSAITLSEVPDAIHLATALEVKVDFLLTNDLAFSKIKGLEIITLSNV